MMTSDRRGSPSPLTPRTGGTARLLAFVDRQPPSPLSREDLPTASLAYPDDTSSKVSLIGVGARPISGSVVTTKPVYAPQGVLSAARQWLLFPTFALLTLLNRVLLTIQFSFTQYPVFVNLYWMLLSAVVFRVIWLVRRRVIPSANPAVLPPQWMFWGLAVVYAVNNVVESVALSKLDGYGELQVLFSQSRLPLSMLFTRLLFRGRAYARAQYLGAAIVVTGIFVTLLPDADRDALPGSDVSLGIGLFAVHCVLAAAYTVLIEKLIAVYSLDEYYMLGANQWQSVIVTLVLLVPQALLAGVSAGDVGNNIERGAKCQFGMTPAGDDSCMGAPYATHAFIVTNVLWTLSAAFVISTLGANSFQLASTATVPFNALIYAIPQMPAHKPISGWSAGGLGMIFSGMVLFQFFNSRYCSCLARPPRSENSSDVKSPYSPPAKPGSSLELTECMAAESVADERDHDGTGNSGSLDAALAKTYEPVAQARSEYAAPRLGAAMMVAARDQRTSGSSTEGPARTVTGPGASL